MRFVMITLILFGLLAFLTLVPGLIGSSAQENQQPKSKFKGFSPEYLKRVEEEEKRRKEALEKAKSGTLTDPDSAEAHFSLAEAYFDDPADTVNNDYDKISQEYKQAIKLQPDYAEAYRGLAKTYGLDNDFKKQFEAFDRAISLKPDDAETYLDLGFAHLWDNIAKSHKYNFTKERKLAIEAFNKAISIKPDYADAYYGLGDAYHSLEMDKEAIEAYNQAISLKPDDNNFHLALGHLYVDLGNKEGATQEYEALVRIVKEKKSLNPIVEVDAETLLGLIEKKFGSK